MSGNKVLAKLDHVCILTASRLTEAPFFVLAVFHILRAADAPVKVAAVRAFQDVSGCLASEATKQNYYTYMDSDFNQRIRIQTLA